jgi:polysaccharide export outer membrane protein
MFPVRAIFFKPPPSDLIGRVGQILVLLLVSVGGFHALAFAQAQPPSQSPLDSGRARDSALHEYRVGPRDMLVVTFWDEPSLSGRFRVEEDGFFTFAMVGRVRAGGLTLREIEQQLRKALANGFFRDPQLSLTLDEYGSQQFFVVGEVRQPGAFPLSGPITLLQALARAGSTTTEAGGEVVILRPKEGTATVGPLQPDEASVSEVLRFDLLQLQRGMLGFNVVLRNGDTVLVPRAETLYVLGQVNSPGAYTFKKGTTVLQALSLAGGVADRGASGRIKVVRVVSGEKKELKLKLNDLVQPGDTILVPEKFF